LDDVWYHFAATATTDSSLKAHPTTARQFQF
jgi:hypothetical protein